MDAEAVPGLIQRYLVEFRQSLGRLPDADDIVAEAEDHLLETVERLERGGLDRFDAEVRALNSFGSSAHVARAFVLEARKGGAVATSFTRRCGLIAVLAPTAFVAGLFLSNALRGGLANNVAVVIATLGAFGGVPALVGLRVRHGGLGLVGRVAFWLAVVAYPVSLPFGYGGLVVLAILLGASFTLWGAAMFRAHVLPRVPVAMFGFSGTAFGVAAAIITAVGGDAGLVWAVPVVTTVSGLAWLGWVMWREAAVDVPAPPAAFAQ